MNRSIDQAGAVVARHDFDARRQRWSDLAQLSLDAINYLQRVFTLPHYDDSANRLAFSVPFGHAFTDVRPKAHGAQIAQQHRRAVLAADCDISEIVERMQIS